MRIKRFIDKCYLSYKFSLVQKGRITWMNPGKLARQAILDYMFYSKKYVSGRVLDVGCGQKPYEFIFKENTKEYIGLDFDKANKKADYIGTALKLPFKSNSFDTIISTQVLEHVEDPRLMINEINRVLKKGGNLILTAPMNYKLHEVPRDFYRYTRFGLNHLFESNGFQVIEIKQVGGFWRVIGQKLSIKFYGDSKSLITKLTKGPICALIQLFFSFLDRLDLDPSETLDYLIIGKKK